MTKKMDLNLYIMGGSEELDLFSNFAPSMIIDEHCIGGRELEFLRDNALQRQTNIRNFSYSFIKDLLQLILPKSCFDGAVIDLNSTDPAVLSSLHSFLKVFWSHAGRKSKFIEAIAEGPAIVLAEGENGREYLCPLSKLSNIISVKRNHYELPERLIPLLMEMNIKKLLLYKEISQDTAAIHDKFEDIATVFWSYVQPPTLQGILYSISLSLKDSGTSILQCFDCNVDVADENAPQNIFKKFILDNIHDIPTLSEEEFATMKKLPIFRRALQGDSGKSYFTALINGSNVLSQQWMTLNDFENIPSFLLTENIILHNSMEEVQLLKKLGVKFLTKASFLVQWVWKDLAMYQNYYKNYPNQVEELLLFVIHNLRALAQQDNTILTALKSLPIIPNNMSELKCIHELFDCTDSDVVLLMNDHLLPAQSLRGEETILNLRNLGLRTVIDWRSILTCARAIELTSEDSETEKSRRSDALLKYLDKNINKLLVGNRNTNQEDHRQQQQQQQQSRSSSIFSSFTSFFSDTNSPKENSNNQKQGQEELGLKKKDLQEFSSELQKIAWMPVMRSPPIHFLPWKNKEQTASDQSGRDYKHICQAPSNCVEVDLIAFASNEKYIIDGKVHSPRLREILGLPQRQSIALQIILSQLLAYSSTFARCKNDHNTLEAMKCYLNEVLPLLYQHLEESPALSSPAIISSLSLMAFIWTGNDFIVAQKIARRSNINAEPYLYTLPSSFNYKRIVDSLQIKEHFTMHDYVETLKRIASEYTNTDSNNQKHPTALPTEVLDIVCSMIILLSNNETSSALKSQDIYAPDNTNKLYLASELVHDDMPWLTANSEIVSIRANNRIVHSNISAKVAEKIGVKSLRLTLFSSKIEQNILDGEDGSNIKQNNLIESFGQTESITSRLKTILDLYPDGSSILYEMIQNADDAGATSIKLLIDENFYETDQLIDNRMSVLQSPALLVQNNSLFSELDFKRIIQIGQNTKVDKLNTTGRFGLGFNSVYHITDTPVIISGESIVFFDPHCNYVPGATFHQPGIRIKHNSSSQNNNYKLHNIFPNQYLPYQFFGYQPGESYPATMFRLPLRNAIQARHSEISKKAYSLHDLDMIIQQLIEKLPSLLIFLRNIQHLQIYRCNANSGNQPTLLYETRVQNIHTIASRGKLKLLEYFQKQSNDRNDHGNEYEKDTFYQELKTTSEDQLPFVLQTKEVIIHQHVANESEQSSSELKAQAVGIQTSNYLYLIATGMQGGSARQIACENNNSSNAQQLKLVPVASIAACLFSCTSEKPVNFMPQIEGKLFCFLPLPITTYLPVHVNSYFELSSNRRDIWRGNDMTGLSQVRAQWNQSILNDVISPLYVDLINALHEHFILYRTISTSNESTNNIHSNNRVRQGQAPNLFMIAMQRLRELLRDESLVIPEVMEYDDHNNTGKKELLFSLLPSQRVIEPYDAITRCVFRLILDKRIFLSQMQRKKFVNAKEAVFYINPTAINPQNMDTIIKVLLEENIPIVNINEDLYTLLSAQGTVSLTLLSQLLVRNHFKKYSLQTQRTKETALLVAGQLLHYCCSDIINADGKILESLESLQRVKLLPLMNGEIGEIKSVIDHPIYYSVDSNESKLLAARADLQSNTESLNITNQLIALEPYVTNETRKLLNSDEIREVCNIRKIADIDLLKLVYQYIVPKHWLDNRCYSVSIKSGEFTSQVVGKEWILALWEYILQKEILHLYSDVFPIIPVISTHNLADSNIFSLARYSEKVAVLSVHGVESYQDLQIEFNIFEGLQMINIFIVDEVSWRPFAHHPHATSTEIVKKVPNITIGFLHALLHITGGRNQQNEKLRRILVENSQRWSAEIRAAMNLFIMDKILSKYIATGGGGKVEELDESVIQLIKLLPIWEIHREDTRQDQFTFIDPEDVFIPPSEVPTSVLESMQALRGVTNKRKFLTVRNPTTLAVYKILKFQTAPLTTFIQCDILPALVASIAQANSNSSNTFMRLVTPLILRNYEQLAVDFPDAANEISCLKFIPTRTVINGQVVVDHACANTLFDPETPLIRQILPDFYFPDSELLLEVNPVSSAQSVDYRSAVMSALRKMGMKQKLSSTHVITACRYISDFYKRRRNEAHDEQTRANLHATIIQKSSSLLRYLDENIESILREQDPLLLEVFNKIQAGDKTNNELSTDNYPALFETLIQRNEFIRELRTVHWISCLTNTDIDMKKPSAGEFLGLPWPEKVHDYSLAAPIQCTTLDNLWFLSNTYRIVNIVNISDTQNYGVITAFSSSISSLRSTQYKVQSDLLLELLTWKDSNFNKLNGKNLSLQILAMQKIFQSFLESSNKIENLNSTYQNTKSKMILNIDEAFPQILHHLNKCFQRESAQEVQAWKYLLTNKAVASGDDSVSNKIFWNTVARDFVEVSKVTLETIPLNDGGQLLLEPYIFLLPDHLREYSAMLTSLGMKEKLGAIDLIALLNAIYRKSAQQHPLSTVELEIVLKTTAHLAKLLGFCGDSSDESNTDTVMTTESNQDFESNAVSPTINSPLPQESELKVTKQLNSTIVKELHAEMKANNFIFLLPDDKQRLQPSKNLTFNDASWLNSADSSTDNMFANTNIRFIHPSLIRYIDNSAFSLLLALFNCKSLRDQLFSGEHIHCSHHKVIRSLIEEDGFQELVQSMLRFADEIYCQSVEIIYDDNNSNFATLMENKSSVEHHSYYKNVSLLHPNFAKLQEQDAIIFHFRGNYLNTESLAKAVLLQTPESSSEWPSAGNQVRSSHLLSSFIISDVIQMLSGNQFFVFDPLKEYLTNDVSPTKASGVQSSAVDSDKSHLIEATGRKYALFKKQTESEIDQNHSTLDTFADQFAPFLAIDESIQQQLVENRYYNGVVLRLPIRSKPSRLSKYLLTTDQVRATYGKLKSSITAALLFAENQLMIASCKHYQLLADAQTLDRQAELVLDMQLQLIDDYQSQRRRRLNLTKFNGWDKQLYDNSASSSNPLKMLFGSYGKSTSQQEMTFNAEEKTEITLEIILSRDLWMTLDKNNSLRKLLETSTANDLVVGVEKYLILSSIGANPINNMINNTNAIGNALNNSSYYQLFHQQMRLLPFVSIALNLSDFELMDANAMNESIASYKNNLKYAPDFGCYGFHSQVLGSTGFPFHVESYFIDTNNASAALNTESITNTKSSTRYSLLRGKTQSDNITRNPKLSDFFGFSSNSSSRYYAYSNSFILWNSTILQTALLHLYPKALTYIQQVLRTNYFLCVNNTSVRDIDATVILKTIYKFWIYLPRLTNFAKKAVDQSNYLSTLFTKSEWFLCKNEFQSLDIVMLNTNPHLPDIALCDFLSRCINIADIPVQLSMDLMKLFGGSSSAANELTPKKLRLLIKKDAAKFQLILRELFDRYTENEYQIFDMIERLLEFLLSDLITPPPSRPMIATNTRTAESFLNTDAEYEFLQSKALKNLQGIPLLVTARDTSNNIEVFPHSNDQKMAFIDDIFLVNKIRLVDSDSMEKKMLPDEILSRVIHPRLFCTDNTKKHMSNISLREIFRENKIAQKTLFLYSLSDPNFLSQFMHYIIPSHYLGHSAVRWIVSEPRVVSINDSLCLESLLYCLWNFSWSTLSPQHLIALYELPVLPVILHAKERVLLNAKFLIHTLTQRTSEDDSRHRKELLLHAMKSEGIHDLQLEVDSTADPWQWTTQSNPHVESPVVEEISAATTADENSALTASAISSTNNSNLEPNQSNANNDTNNTAELLSALLLSTNNRICSAEIESILITLGFPFLDNSIFEQIPSSLRNALSGILYNTDQSRSNSQANLVIGKKLLDALYELNNDQLTVFDDISGTAKTSKILKFNQLSISERGTLLLEIFHAHKFSPFDTPTQNKLRALPLFTNQLNGENISISDLRSQQVFFCHDSTVFKVLELNDTLLPYIVTNNTNTNNSTMEKAGNITILSSDNRALIELYKFLNIKELTVFLALTELIAPKLESLTLSGKLLCIEHLVGHWSSYKQTNDFVTLLKNKSFIPSLAANINADNEETEELVTYYKASDLLLFTNSELLQVLSTGSNNRHHSGKYFVHPSLRVERNVQFFVDLGMQIELEKSCFLRIIRDIEADFHFFRDANNTSIHSSSSSASASSENNIENLLWKSSILQDLVSRSRALLRYILQQERYLNLFDNHSTLQQIRTVEFVPMQQPVGMNEGGEVIYELTISSFNKFVSRSCGLLCFSVLPVIESDIAPPNNYFASLNIRDNNSSVPLEAVLRHLRHLISCKSLFKWKNLPQYSILDAFNALFTALQDRQQEIPNTVKSQLQREEFVPILTLSNNNSSSSSNNHLQNEACELVAPNKLFFKLVLNLSPFFHELPRCFGSHERFFKETLKVKEEPQLEDYLHFLRELYQQLNSVAVLNPNEFRAIFMIVSAIDNLLEAQQHTNFFAAAANREMFFLPDEDFSLRNIDDLLIDDNDELKHALMQASNESMQESVLTTCGLYLLHRDFERVMRQKQYAMRKLSDVVREELTRADPMPATATAQSLQDQLHRLQREEQSTLFTLAQVICELTSQRHTHRTEENNQRDFESDTDLRSAQDITETIQTMQLRFALSLSTSFSVVDQRLSRRTTKQHTRTSIFYVLRERETVVYLNASQVLNHELSLSAVLALAFCGYFNLPASHATTLCFILERSISGSSTTPAMNFLHAMGLSDFNNSSNSNSNSNYNNVQQDKANSHRHRGKVGFPLLAGDLQLLEMKPLRAFQAQEIIAYDANRLSSLPENTSQRFCYGKVVGVAESHDENNIGLRKVDVKTGRGIVRMLSTELYCFKSFRDSTRNNSIKGNQTTTRNEQRNQLKNRIETPSNMETSHEETSKISATEIVNAVQSMLLRANLPLSLNQEDLMTKVLELQIALRNSEELLQQERQCLLNARQNMDDLLVKFKCSICLEKMISRTLVPCGHSFCADCTQQHLLSNTSRRVCPTCRARFTENVQLYF